MTWVLKRSPTRSGRSVVDAYLLPEADRDKSPFLAMQREHDIKGSKITRIHPK